MPVFVAARIPTVLRLIGSRPLLATNHNTSRAFTSLPKMSDGESENGQRRDDPMESRPAGARAKEKEPQMNVTVRQGHTEHGVSIVLMTRGR